MIEDVLIIDAVVHNYNLDPSNYKTSFGRDIAEMIYGFHTKWQTPEHHVPHDAWITDWPSESLAEVLFLESQTDMGGSHVLCLDSWFNDGCVSFEKNVEISQRWPNRFFVYLGVDPFNDPQWNVEELRRQKEAIPSAIGIKLYPDRVNPFGRFRLDDPEMSYPLLEVALELGLKNIAIHKAIPNGPVPLEPYSVVDVDAAASAFPDLNFEIVHGGMAFLEETALAIARFPNVYVNLEVTALYGSAVPGQFDHIMGTLLFWAGPEKILWGTSGMVYHPQPQIEAFWNYQISPRMQERYSLEPLTKKDKALIFGENYARLLGLDVQALKAGFANDEFSKQVKENGLAKPYSHWKARAGVAVG